MNQPFSNEHDRTSALGEKPFVAIRDPKIRVRLAQIDIHFLPDGMGTVDDTVDARFFADLHECLPGHQGAGDRCDGINYRDDLLPRVAGDGLKVRAVPGDDGGVRRRPLNHKLRDLRMALSVVQEPCKALHRVVCGVACKDE